MRHLAAAVADLVDLPLLGDLGAAAVLADDLVALARLTQVLTVEVARRAAAAHDGDVTATGVRAELQAAGWTAPATNRAVRLGRFLNRYPDAAAAVRGGCLSIDAAVTLDCATRSLPAQQRDHLIAWLLSWAPRLDTAAVKIAVTAAVDALRPHDAATQEQRDYDDRALTFTRFRNMVLFQGRLPAIDGEAFIAAVTAYAQRHRNADPSTSSGTGGQSSGTGGQADGAGGQAGATGGQAGGTGGDAQRATSAQRAADGLTALVADATRSATAPHRHGGAAAVSVLIPVSEADRVCAGQPRRPIPLPDLTTANTRPRNAVIVGTGIIAEHHTLADAAARYLLCAGDLTGVLIDTTSPIGGLLGGTRLQSLALGRTTRLATRAQRTALAVRDRGCVIPGCDVGPDNCQAHHVTDWAAGGPTDLDQLALLCVVHHRQVDLHRWKLTRNPNPTAHYWTVTPTPRHTWRPRT